MVKAAAAKLGFDPRPWRAQLAVGPGHDGGKARRQSDEGLRPDWPQIARDAGVYTRDAELFALAIHGGSALFLSERHATQTRLCYEHRNEKAGRRRRAYAASSWAAGNGLRCLRVTLTDMEIARPPKVANAIKYLGDEELDQLIAAALAEMSPTAGGSVAGRDPLDLAHGQNEISSLLQV